MRYHWRSSSTGKQTYKWHAFTYTRDAQYSQKSPSSCSDWSKLMCNNKNNTLKEGKLKPANTG